MAFLEESPLYQEILKQGRLEGRLEELLSGIELALELKFGTEGLQLMSSISQISDVNVLKEIQQGLWTMNTLDELRRIYIG